MIQKFTFLSLFIFLISLNLSTQAQGTIKGTVTEAATGTGIIGANVVIEGTTQGAATDLDGNYILPGVKAGTITLVVSLIGSTPQSQIVTVQDGKTVTVDFALSEDTELLEELVVIGYGSQRKREVVGSVKRLETKDLTDIVGGSFDNALQGKAAGVQVSTSSGVAGAPSFIRIRGVGSLSAGGEPLYVVDGIAISQDMFVNGGAFFDQNNNPLATLNPNDIESIEILKDASAAAIYGSRGANGVILISTKRGNGGGAKKPSYNFSSRVGLSTPSNMLEFLDAEEWLGVRQEAWENDGNVGRAPLPGLLTENGYTYESIEGIDTDWMSTVVQTGVKQEYNLGMNLPGQKLSAYVGLGWSDVETFIVGNRFQRGSARANLDWRFSKKGTLSVSTSLARSDNDRIRQQFNGGFAEPQSRLLPIYPMLDQNGDYFYKEHNPIAQRELTDINTLEWRSINSLAFNFAPVKGLNLSVSGNYDYMDVGDYQYESEEWVSIFNPQDPFSVAKANMSEVFNWSTYATAEYDVLQNNKAHDLKVLIGGEYQQSTVNGEFIEWANVDDHIYTNPTKGENFIEFQNNSFERDFWKFASGFGRLNYDYKGKYLAQFTFRRDGSSKFGRNRRFGNFPSVGLGYILSDEAFLKQNEFINFLKLKASWGITGNADINWREQFSSRSYPESGVIGIRDYYNNQPIRFENKPENPNLQWEVNTTYDAGVEFGLMNDRITGELAYYYKLTTDAIIRNSIQASIGVPNLQFFENVGEIENQGVELSLTSRNTVGPFKWTSTLNMARNKNLVISVGTAQADALAGGFGDVRVLPGYPLGSNYINVWSHVDPTTGRPVYLTPDGQETFDYDVVNNRTVAGDIYPEFTGGFNNTFRFKNFDLSMLWTFQIGGTIFDDAAKRNLGVVTDWQMSRNVLDRWRQPGDMATYPQLTMSMLNWGGNDNFWQNNHTLWLHDGTYYRLKNLNFGYTIKPKGDGTIENMRIYFLGTNLYTITDYIGWDPEVSRERGNSQERNVAGQGVSFLTAPQEKTYSLGLTIDF